MAKDESRSSSKLHTNLLNFADVCAAVSVRERLCVYSSISECIGFCISDLRMDYAMGTVRSTLPFLQRVCLGLGTRVFVRVPAGVEGVRARSSCMQEGVLMIA